MGCDQFYPWAPLSKKNQVVIRRAILSTRIAFLSRNFCHSIPEESAVYCEKIRAVMPVPHHEPFLVRSTPRGSGQFKNRHGIRRPLPHSRVDRSRPSDTMPPGNASRHPTQTAHPFSLFDAANFAEASAKAALADGGHTIKRSTVAGQKYRCRSHRLSSYRSNRYCGQEWRQTRRLHNPTIELVSSPDH